MLNYEIHMRLIAILSCYHGKSYGKSLSFVRYHFIFQHHCFDMSMLQDLVISWWSFDLSMLHDFCSSLGGLLAWVYFKIWSSTCSVLIRMCFRFGHPFVFFFPQLPDRSTLRDPWRLPVPISHSQEQYYLIQLWVKMIPSLTWMTIIRET